MKKLRQLTSVDEIETGKYVEAFSQNRRCKYCKSVLSTYNPMEYCFRHAHIGALEEDREYMQLRQKDSDRQRKKRRALCAK